MLNLPDAIMARLEPFAPLFTRRTWRHVPLLVAGAILAPGRRRVSSLLRVMGHREDAAFSTYHRVLNRAVWSSLGASRILLGLLIAAFAPDGPLVLGIDETLERRRGKRLTATGLYRDPVRSSHGHFVKARALRWVSLRLLVPIPWAGRTWALPFLSVLAPAERYDQEHQRRHKVLTDWARQMVQVVQRWCPARRLVLVGDTSYAVVEFLAATGPRATIVTRLRLDARLFTPAPPRRPGQRGRPRLVGTRLPPLAARLSDPTTAWTKLTVPFWYGERERTIEICSQTAVWYHPGRPPVPLRWVLIRDPADAFPPQALLCTDLDTPPAQIVCWFVLRWQMESTCHEVRDHLGVETGRGWSERTIRRSTPALLGLFSFVTLLAQDHWAQGTPLVRRAAWYHKRAPTFSDALAVVRRSLWAQTPFCVSPPDADLQLIPRALVEHLCDLLSYAA
jgi:DDE superfamily endonuclease